jgi:hypothetical protein
MFRQQLQHLDKLTCTRSSTVSLLKLLAQTPEFIGQTPVLVQVRMIQISWLAFQQRQIMHRLEDHFPLGIATLMASNALRP